MIRLLCGRYGLEHKSRCLKRPQAQAGRTNAHIQRERETQREREREKDPEERSSDVVGLGYIAFQSLQDTSRIIRVCDDGLGG
eukprot:176422-Amphidinium_carterae.1